MRIVDWSSDLCSSDLFADSVAKVQARLDLGCGRIAGPDPEAICAGDATRVEQGVDRQLMIFGTRPFNPEFAECRKLFAGHFAGIDRQTARRLAVNLLLAQHADVTGAVEGDQLLLLDIGRAPCRERM